MDFDAKVAIARASEMNADTIRFGTVGKYALIQNEQIPLHSGLNGRDLLEEVIPEAKKAGIKVIAYVPVSHGLPESLISDLHREALTGIGDVGAGRCSELRI